MGVRRPDPSKADMHRAKVFVGKAWMWIRADRPGALARDLQEAAQACPPRALSVLRHAIGDAAALAMIQCALTCALDARPWAVAAARGALITLLTARPGDVRPAGAARGLPACDRDEIPDDEEIPY